MMTGPADYGEKSRGAEGGATIGETLVQGALQHRVVELVYHGSRRSVEPYLVGIHQAGEAILLGYQTAGLGRSGDVPGWRTFIIAEVAEAVLTDRSFVALRPDFNRNDSRMTEIFARA
jgi:hypothetical protein